MFYSLDPAWQGNGLVDTTTGMLSGKLYLQMTNDYYSADSPVRVLVMYWNAGPEHGDRALRVP